MGSKATTFLVFLKKRKKLYDILREEIISEIFKNNKNMSLSLDKLFFNSLILIASRELLPR